jgi:hypothetical protein
VIGIALLDDAREEQDHQQHIVAYLHDGDDPAQMVGEVDADGTGTLESGDLSDFDASVEVTIDDGAVSGTATLPGEQPTPYTADAATGVARVYWMAETTRPPRPVVTGHLVLQPPMGLCFFSAIYWPLLSDADLLTECR